jgi:hypothetical protein
MLDLEAEADVVPDAKYEVLDSILADAKNRLIFDPTERDCAKMRAQVLATLKAIDDVLTDHNVIYPPGDWILTLAEALQPQELTPETARAAMSHAHSEPRRARIRDHQNEKFYYMDCDILCFTYMSIGELVGLQLKFVEVPHHNFIRYHFDGAHYIDWETTAALEFTDDFYRRGFSMWTERDRVYLTSMTNDELMGYFYSTRGDRCTRLNPPKFKQAAADFERAIALRPQSPGPRNWLSWIHIAVPDFWHGSKMDAIELALRAVSVEPDCAGYLDTLATAYAEAGDWDKAQSFEKDAIKNFVPADPRYASEPDQYLKRLALFEKHITYIQAGGDPKNDPHMAPHSDRR